MKPYWKPILVVLVGTLILSVNHIFNGFPLILGDSRGYLNRAHSLIESSHWSNTYIIFLAAIFKVFKSIQFIAIIQNLFVAIMLNIFMRHFLPNYKHWKYLAITLIMILTSLTWITSIIMSDIFTSICLISIILILLKQPQLFEWFVIIPIFFIAISAHQSHLLILPVFTLSVLFFQYLAGSYRHKKMIRDLLVLSGMFVLSNLVEKNIIDLFSQKNKTEVTKSDGEKQDISSGYYFIAIRIAESGNLKELISEFCIEHQNNYLCKETGSYDASRIKTTKYHERHDNNKQYIQFSQDTKEFVLFSLTRIRTYIGFSQLVIKRGFTLLRNTKVQRSKPLDEKQDEYFMNVIRRVNPDDLEAYQQSKQKNDGYVFYRKWTFYKWLPIWWKILFPLTLILNLYFMIKQRSNILGFQNLAVIFYLMLGHFINTVICGTFSNFENVRYSSRTLWLVNLSIIISLTYFIEYKKNSKLNLPV